MRTWRDRVRQLAAGLGALAATLALMAWGASPASAGGPTSVLIVSPQSTETASLYATDERYAELEGLLGATGQGSRVKPPEAGLEASRQINVTWLAHDVMPWRVDRVYPAFDDRDVWIHTSTDVPGSLNGYWHRAERPAQLRALLKELGVMGKASPGGSHGIFPGERSDVSPAPEPTDGSGIAVEGDDTAPAGTADSAGTAAAAPAARAAGAADGTDGWWALPGAAAGAVLALVLRPFAERIPLSRRKRAAEPRQELLDM